MIIHLSTSIKQKESGLGRKESKSSKSSESRAISDMYEQYRMCPIDAFERHPAPLIVRQMCTYTHTHEHVHTCMCIYEYLPPSHFIPLSYVTSYDDVHDQKITFANTSFTTHRLTESCIFKLVICNTDL